MQLESVGVATKGIGEDDVGAAVDKALMQIFDALGMVEVPKLWRFARPKAALEIVGAGGTIGEQYSP